MTALPINDSTVVFSSNGFLYLLGSVVAIILLGSLGISCLQLLRSLCRPSARDMAFVSPGAVLLSITVLTNLLMLGLLNTRYGNSTYEDRYLIMVYCLSMLLLAHLLKESGLQRWIFRAVAGILFLCLTVRTVTADIAYTNTRINTPLMDAVTATVDTLPSSVIFTCTETDQYNLMFRNMRCYDVAHVYKPIKAGPDDAVTLNKRYQSEADSSGIAWKKRIPPLGRLHLL